MPLDKSKRAVIEPAKLREYLLSSSNPVGCHLDRPEQRGGAAVRDGVPWSGAMNYKILDVVVLQRDISPNGLRRGDVGAVVELYEPDGLEVEFVLASGRTTAVLTLNVSDVRHVEAHDMLSVRSVA